MEVRSRRGCEEGPEHTYGEEMLNSDPSQLIDPRADSTPRIDSLDKKLVRKRAPRRQRMNPFGEVPTTRGCIILRPH